MKMFVWDSEFLRAYGRGTLVAMGETVEDARAKLTAELREHMLEEKGWLDIKGWRDNNAHYDAEEIEKWRQVFLEDISAEPQIVETLWIRGSE